MHVLVLLYSSYAVNRGSATAGSLSSLYAARMRALTFETDDRQTENDDADILTVEFNWGVY